MTIESSLSFLLAIFIFGITPGPGVFAILARAMVSGARSCFFLALGMVVSNIIYLILACPYWVGHSGIAGSVKLMRFYKITIQNNAGQL